MDRAKIAELVESRWYAFFDLACVTTACALWYLSRGQLGWWPLLVGVAAWPARALTGRFPIKRTPFDWVLLIFLLTAVMGTWIAYNPLDARGKWWLIAGAVLFYYALAGQPALNIWPVMGLFGLVGTFFAAYFLLTNDWAEQTVKIGALYTVGLRWTALRPQIPPGVHRIHPNIVGGLLAMLAPALLAYTWFAYKQRRLLLFSAFILAGLIMFAGLLLTASRGSWLALAGALLAWLIWVVSKHIGRALYLSRRQAFFLCLVPFLLLAAAIILFFPGGLAGLAGQLPGPSSVSRLELSENTWALAQDFLFTGGGLASFPGLYSQYSLLIPSVFLGHAHNLFLDVLLEQGIVGLAMILILLGGSVWLLTGSDNTGTGLSSAELITGSLLAGITVIALHGLVEDALYGSRGTIFLFLFSGLAVSLTGLAARSRAARRTERVKFLIALTAFAIVLGLGGLFFRQQLRAAWLANIGSLEMARVDLSEWPSGEWREDDVLRDLDAPQALFLQAVRLDSANGTALFRLGLIALARRDFADAEHYLAQAGQSVPQRRGVRKAWGYAALWNGDERAAADLLASIPESESELATYVWWWEQQGRPDLSELAARLLPGA